MTGAVAELSALDLAEVSERVLGCTLCTLSGSRTNAVPGSGPLRPRILFIGEGPGYHEDREGVPFVGAAGNLLNELLSSIGLARDEVFITNIVKCRPPGNRDPEQDEIEACRPYLSRQIELLDPPVIVTLGGFALGHFFPGARISRVHGQARRIGGRLLLPMLHPAAALYRAAWRPQLEQDFHALRAALDAEEVARATGKVDAGGAATEEDDSAEQLTLF